MKQRLKFYAITHDILGDVFWDVFRKGLMDAAFRYDVDVEHLRPGKFSPEIQAKLIDAAVHSRPDGIISTIPSVKTVEQPLRTAISAGIPVICVNAKDDRPRQLRIPYMLYIGGDDNHAGTLAANYLLDSVQPTSALCVDHYLYEHVCHNNRWIGFQNVFTDRKICVTRLRVPGEELRGSARKVASFLEENPDVDAILTLGPPGAQAVLEAASLSRPATFPKHLTFDVAPLQIEGIRTGQIIATIDSQQYLQGYLSVEWMWLHKTYGFVLPSDIYTGPTIVDQKNVEIAAEGVNRGFR
jgi:simple sugar transport system substrate-binding protein